jgi:threonine dehydrogenase-like Zn-dependent dehydrogenase
MTQAPSVEVLQGRPNIAVIVRKVVGYTDRDERVIVMGCGPEGLMTGMRNAVASCVTLGRPIVELHAEAFGR